MPLYQGDMTESPDDVDSNDNHPDDGMVRVGDGKSQRLLEIMAEQNDDVNEDRDAIMTIDPKGE